MGFWLKKALSLPLMPLPASLLLMAWGLWRLRRPATPVRGRRMLLAGALLLYLASLPAVAWLLLHPLEAGQHGYERVDRPIAAISVLGGGYHDEEGRPLTGGLSDTSVVRVAEAVRVAHLHPEARLHCSGWGGLFERGSNARAACALAVALGVAPTRVVLHEAARDTEDEARAVAAAVGDGEVVLVTHASHMPRAAALFERAGLRVLPAPTGHATRAEPSLSPLPGASALGMTTAAWHEWLGRAWLWVKGAPEGSDPG